MKNIRDYILFIISAVLSVYLRIYLLIKLYEWFVMKTFDAPAISFAQAFGVLLLFSFLAKKIDIKPNKDFVLTDEIKLNLERAALSLIALGIGYIAFSFV